MTTGNELDNSAVIELTGKIMVVAVIVFFAVVVLVFFLHLYAKWFLSNRNSTTTTATTPIQQRLTTHGLDVSILKSIPIVIFPTSTQQEEQGLECAVCLSQFSNGEKARLLPKCNHGFHVECIDMWFQSHSTCPICRNPLSLDLQPCNSSSSDDISIIEISSDDESQVSQVSHVSSFPTNILFWGNETQVNNQIEHTPPPQLPVPSSSTSTTGRREDHEAIVIEILRQMIEDESSSKTPVPVPVPTRMSSFKRLLSRDTTRISPTVVEQVPRGQT